MSEKIKDLPPSSDKDFWKGDVKTVDLSNRQVPKLTNDGWKKIGSMAVKDGEIAVSLDWKKYTIKDGEIVRADTV